MIGEWTVALSAVGGGVGVATLAYLVMHNMSNRIDSRIDSTVTRVTAHVDTRFAEAEARRMEAAAHWKERFDDRDRRIDDLRKTVDENRSEHAPIQADLRALRDAMAEQAAQTARDYVRFEDWRIEAGAVRVKLDKIKDSIDRLPQRGNPQ